MVNVYFVRAGIGQKGEAGLDRNFGELRLFALPERIEIRGLDLISCDFFRGKCRGSGAPVNSASDVSCYRAAEESRLFHRATVDHQAVKGNSNRFSRRGHHLGADRITDRHGFDGLVVGGDVDLEVRWLAQLVSPVAMIRGNPDLN